MPKPPRVEYVLTRPADPGWWRRHRHQVFGALGVLVGFWLCHGCGTTADTQPHHRAPHPSTTVPSIRPLPTETESP